MTNQEPVIRVMPPYKSTLGEVAGELGESFGIKLDEWQQRVINDWLALDENGKWAAGTCGLSVPRQNGKTALVTVRAIYGAASLGETILFTAHEVRTSRQVFKNMAEILSPYGQFKDLAESVESIRSANGYEEIKFSDWEDEDGNWHNGGRISFSSRSRGAARGFTVDCVIADEAMSMTDDHAAALMPTMSSSKSKDAQLILLGTPPSPGDFGTVFRATRNSALRKEAGINWNEWSVDSIGDTKDWERVLRTNPSLDIRLLRKAVESEMGVMSPDCFARERLGWWSPEGTINAVIQQQDWQACHTDNPNNEGITCYAVKFSPDASYGALARAVKHDDGTAHVEIVDARNMGSGLYWLIDWIVERQDKAAEIVIDGSGLAQTLIDRLIDAGVHKRSLHKPRAAEFISATASFVNAVKEQRVTHYYDDELDFSATKTSRRPIGKEGFGFQSTEYADASLIEAVCLAYHSATTTKRNPNRKTGVCF